MVKDGKTGTAKIHRENGIRLRKKIMSERMNESRTFEAMVQSKRRMLKSWAGSCCYIPTLWSTTTRILGRLHLAPLAVTALDAQRPACCTDRKKLHSSLDPTARAIGSRHVEPSGDYRRLVPASHNLVRSRSPDQPPRCFPPPGRGSAWSCQRNSKHETAGVIRSRRQPRAL